MGAVILLQSIIFGAIIWLLIVTGRDERRELELKLLALCDPPAAVHVESVERGSTGSVYVMDDMAMVEKANRDYAASKAK